MRHSRLDAPDVVVVGAGLGGLATAIAARQAGRSVVVLERFDGPSEVDTGITLWSFAVRTLRLLGVEDANQVGGPLERFVSYSADGQLLSDVDLRPASQAVGAASFDVHRSELLDALLDILGPGHVRYRAECVGVREESGRAVAEVADGSEVGGRVVIGADGVRSAVRPHVEPDVAIRTTDMGAWRGVLELSEREVPSGVHMRIYGPGGLFGVARLDDRRVRWYAGGRVRPEVTGTWVELAERFADWCEPVATIVKTSRERDLLYNDTPRFPPLSRWVRGRIALVGDAAHAAVPTLGISGGIALTDGLALGTALTRGLDPPALEAYARRRQRVGRRVQREAEAFGLVVAPRRPRIAPVRDRLFSAPFDWFLRRGVAHLSRGAEAPIVTELLPHPADRGAAPIADQPADLADPAADACLAVLRRTTGVDRGPMELHCERVCRIALRLAERDGDDIDALALHCAALLHDIGLYDPWWAGDAYFFGSARAARSVLEPLSWPPQRLALCLEAIRRHHALADQSAHGAEVELLRRADLIDITGGRVRFGVSKRWLEDLFEKLPRSGLTRHVAWLLLRRIRQSPSSAARLLAEAIRQGLRGATPSPRRGADLENP